MKTLQCRAHGGTFKIGPKRGRDPVNCGGIWPNCTRIPLQATPAQVAKAVRTFVPEDNPSIAPAIAAKRRLVELGWECKGTVPEAGMADLIATRGDETVLMRWKHGVCSQQEYSLWHQKPSANGMPADSLTFNPDECTDRELVRALAGTKVTWWNVLGQKTEEAIIAPESIKIEHAYNGHGDEQPGDRIVKFIEHGGAGFRAFRMSALLKVG